MRSIRAFFLRILRTGATSADFDSELQSHIEMHTDEGVRSGLTPEEARRVALLRLGGAEQTRQAHRERASIPWFEMLRYDVRYALRGFRRNAVFTFTAVVTLGLGIGATTAVFSVVDRILFRALPYAHPDRLVSVGLTAPIIPQEFMLGGSYYTWQDNQQPFEAFTSYLGVDECDLTERNPSRLSCASVEASFLPTLGISPLHGRNFLPDEDRPNGPKVALISYALWSGHYGNDPAILNRQIDLDGSAVRVVGVLPRDFEMPSLEAVDVLVPEALDVAAQRRADPGRVMYAFARLKPGIDIPKAVAALQPVFNYSLNLAPPRFRSEVHLRVRTIRDRQMQNARLAAWILLGTVLAVLLIACANVASLLLTRMATRGHELAVRAALGASRGRLIRQSLTESLLLSLIGAAAGCGLAAGLLRVFIAIAPTGLPFISGARLDPRILIFMFSLALVSGLMFGLVPALHHPQAAALTARSAASARARLRQSMVIAQIAASMVLLAGAALLLRSFAQLASQPLGLESRGVLAARMSLNRYRYPTPQAQMDFFLRAEASLRRLPGIIQLGCSDTVPPGGPHHDQIFSNISVAGRPPQSGATGGMVVWRWVTPSYFAALNIPIVRGKPYTEDQRTSNDSTVIISSMLAAPLFSNQDPIGQRIQLVPKGPWYVIQAVAANVKNAGLDTADEPEFYLLRHNLVADWQSAPSAVFTLKTSLPAKAVSAWVQSEIASIDPSVPVEIGTLNESVGRLADRPRFETALMTFFALTGLAMAIIGLYGVMAYRALQRTQEIGIRMALGARRTDILRLILSEGVRLIVIGSSIGLVVSLALSRLLKSLLFNVDPHDPISFATVTITLSLVALLATLLPARRAACVNPNVALRAE